MRPGDGTKVVGINKIIMSTIKEAGFQPYASMTVTHAPVGTIRQLPPVLLYSSFGQSLRSFSEKKLHTLR